MSEAEVLALLIRARERMADHHAPECPETMTEPYGLDDICVCGLLDLKAEIDAVLARHGQRPRTGK